MLIRALGILYPVQVCVGPAEGSLRLPFPCWCFEPLLLLVYLHKSWLLVKCMSWLRAGSPQSCVRFSKETQDYLGSRSPTCVCLPAAPLSPVSKALQVSGCDHPISVTGHLRAQSWDSAVTCCRTSLSSTRAEQWMDQPKGEGVIEQNQDMSQAQSRMEGRPSSISRGLQRENVGTKGETEHFPERRERDMVLQIWNFDQTQDKMNGKHCTSDTLVKCLTPNTRKQPKSFQRVWHPTSLSQSTYLKTVEPNIESLREVHYQVDGDESI